MPTVVTFHPHPREVLGYGVELLSTLERRLELLAELGVEETLVVEFTPEVAGLEPEAFAESYLLGDRRGARRRRAPGSASGAAGGGDLALLERLGRRRREVAARAEGVSSTRIRQLIAAGDIRAAAALLGRPVEVEGVVVSGDARGGTLGFPTANLRIERALLVPAFGIYAGSALDHRAAISIGVNPHYGGAERRIEAFLLDFEGDLYGQRVVVELWERLRDEAAFSSEAELVDADRARRRGGASRDPSLNGAWTPSCPAGRARRESVEEVARPPPPRLAGRLARAREEGRRGADEPALSGGARGGALPRVDRRTGRHPRRGDVPATLHAATAAERVVTAEHRDRRAPPGRRADAAGRPSGGRAGEGGRALGGRLCGPGDDRGLHPSSSRRSARSRAPGSRSRS